jgi:indole-3-glycerol phosphate synthase/phosphoribosylanthranilate isomerase
MPTENKPSVLQTIIAHKQTEIAEWQADYPFTYWLEKATVNTETPQAFEIALRAENPQGGVHLICELKPKSPSLGVLQSAPNVPAIIADYTQVASAISVLTDATFFGGSFDLLEEVKSLTALPVLCKDFIIDPYQVLVAVACKADAVLLIMKALDDITYVTLFETIRSYGLTPVVEVQNEAELKRALLVHPSVILINNRDLDTLEMHPETVAQLAHLLSKDCVIIAASGMGNRADIERYLPHTSACLVGSQLMKTSPQDRLNTLKALKNAEGIQPC